MKNQFAMRYEDGRLSERFDTLQGAVAHVALAHENVELTPDGKDVRVHIGPLTLGKIVQRKGWDN
jgi:hypothetical protein